MLIQPFIENAIEHAFKNLESKGHINLSILKKNESFIIEIIDNGLGMTKEQINSIETGDYKPSGKRSHIGLKNVEQRIKYLHENSEFHIISEFGQGTTIRIILPM